MVTLDDISNLIYFQFRKRQYDALKKKRLGIFHVSDYVQDCVRNSYYAHLQGNGKKSMDTTTMSVFFSGEAVHQLLDNSAPKGLGETPLAYNFIDDKPVELFDADGNVLDSVKDISVDEWLKILVGEADSLYKIDIKGKKEWVIVDYKTWLSKGFKKREASPEHKIQVNSYRYLLNKSMNIDVKYGAIIYLDFNDRMEKPLIFTFKLDDMEKIRNDLILKYEQFKNAKETGVLPDRTYSWKCNGYCPYAERCFNEDKLEEGENNLVVTV